MNRFEICKSSTYSYFFHPCLLFLSFCKHAWFLKSWANKKLIPIFFILYKEGVLTFTLSLPSNVISRVLYLNCACRTKRLYSSWCFLNNTGLKSIASDIIRSLVVPKLLCPQLPSRMGTVNFLSSSWQFPAVRIDFLKLIMFCHKGTLCRLCHSWKDSVLVVTWPVRKEEEKEWDRT